ncbi:MAG: c-type cytochrome [Proteobacteria bacterium]|nr:c-type cytochrome [Pseudomonadota bacterium]
MRFPTVAAAIIAGAIILPAGTALADGDAAAGEKVFKKCMSCHTVEAGKTKATGPNLLGVVGRKAGTADYKYSDALIQAGEGGLVWTPEALDDYIEDPKEFLAAQLGIDKSKVKNKMAFKLKKDDQRADVIAYLSSLSN